MKKKINVNLSIRKNVIMFVIIAKVFVTKKMFQMVKSVKKNVKQLNNGIHTKENYQHTMYQNIQKESMTKQLETVQKTI